MATVTTNHEKYSRLALMLVKGGTKVTRALFEKCYKEMTPENHVPFPWTIDEFLLANKTTILSNQTGRNKERFFFPGASGTEIDHWDLHMFCFVLLDVCKVSRVIRMDVDQLRKMRNKLCHLNEPSLDTSVYERYVDKIEVNFDRLLAEIDDQQLKEDIANILHTAKEEPLSLQPTLNVMHQFYSMEGDTRQCLSKLSEDIRVMMEKMKEMDMKFDLVLKNQKENTTEAVKVSETFIELLVKNCDSVIEVFISRLLVNMYKEVTGGITTAQPNVDHSKLIATVRDTVEIFTAKDRPIVDAEENCVSLRIRCTSVASLVSLFDDCIVGDLTKEFKSLEECIREIRGCEDVTLEAVMFEDDVWKTISKTISSMEEMISRWYSTAVQPSTASQNSDISRISDVNLVERLSPSTEEDKRIHHAVRLTIRTDQIGKDQLKQSVKDGSLDSSINRLREELVDQCDLTKLSIEARILDEESPRLEGASKDLSESSQPRSSSSPKTVTMSGPSSLLKKFTDESVEKREYVRLSKRVPVYKSSGESRVLLNYADVKVRESSFEKQWPDELKHLVKSLAEDGFYKFGSGDTVRCFSCNLIINNWKQDDVPWKLHAKYSKDCVFIRSKHGEEIDDCIFCLRKKGGKKMATVTTNPEKYIRLALMLVKGGTTVTRALFEKSYKAMTPKDHVPFPWTIDEFVQANKKTILSSQTGRANERILYPGDSGTEIDHWNLNMFCFVLVDVCGVSRDTRMYIDKLKQIKNRLTHFGEPSVDDKKYGSYIGKIEVIFDRLLAEIDDHVLKKEIYDLLKAVKEGPFSLQDTLNVMHAFYSMEGDIRETLSQQSKDIKNVMAKLRETKRQAMVIYQNKTEAVKVPEFAIEALVQNCASDKEEFIAKLLMDMYKEGMECGSDMQSKEEYSKLMEAVKDIVNRFTAQDKMIVDVEKISGADPGFFG